MNVLPDHGAEGRSNWMVRGALLVALVAAIFSARQLVGSRSLRMAEAPQRIALVDVPPPPPREEPPVEQTPQPEDQTPAPADGLDNGPALPDLGPSPIDDQLGLDSTPKPVSTPSGCAPSAAAATSLWISASRRAPAGAAALAITPPGWRAT